MICLAHICLLVVTQLNAYFVPYKSYQVAKVNDPNLPGHVLLAHNYLAGQHFFELEPGDKIAFNADEYVVAEIRSYQALDPYNGYGDLVNLETKKQITSTEAYQQIYYYDGLVLQTCIEEDDIPAWGRLFVLAERKE